MAQDTDISAELEDKLSQHRRRQTPASGTLVMGSQEAYVGDEVTLLGRNLPESIELTVVWHSVNGSWGVLKANEILGPQYQSKEKRLTTVTTDADGKFDESIEIPEDYGGAHTVELRAPDGTNLGQGEIEVTPHFEIENRTAPLGEVFTITGYGLGPNPLTNNYQVTWDNGMVGFMTGVMNNGKATAQIRAAGPVGEHVVQVWRNYRGVPFLQNNTQSPYGPVAGGRQSSWTVETTEPEGEPESMWIDAQFDETPLEVHYPDIDEDTDAELEITPTSGKPGTTAFIRGENFPSDEEVDLVWYRHQGHRVKGIPITPVPQPDVLPSVTTDENGSFQVEVEIPRDVGSTRPITAEIDGTSVAITGFMMQPDVVDISPKKGPVGTEIDIKITGIGWTVYENAPYFVYDNKPIGYVCGVDDEEENGITHIKIRASGEPGYHFIDAYPCIFEMRDEEPNFEIKPHLSYLDNHPVRPLPAFHFAFEVTE
ncbi:MULTISPECIES: hypothetical protein [Haloferax]|uniref:Uncharacterized protein n=1 Tax=Haloferax marinum TaxID=2666143 RepID=A0A6A8G4F3_9EURY|nr:MULTISPECIES: hypothetical protein [Haloferax]KAB1196979.1 hypothetical protein Hfx1150_05360 [Haloferax sp. CBA1150]MRW96001.1 hypothetical protein [Haloferax marinum]